MADLVVKSDTQLDTFLRANGVQQWRVPILAANRGVAVLRGVRGPSVLLAGASTRLLAKDIVKLASPLPTACVAALQKEADTNWRDYAIAPGIDPPDTPQFNERMRKFLRVRTNTILIDTTAYPAMASVQGFLRGIATSELITNPIRDLIIVGHGSGVSGLFKIALTPGDADVVTYEVLEQAVKLRSIVANAALMLPRPKGADPARVRLFGCAVGRVAPFMQKLKEALGNQLLVTAPNNLLLGAEFPARLGKITFTGQLAYMAYAFRVYLVPPKTPPGKKKRPGRTKEDLVAAFVAVTRAEADAQKGKKLTPAQVEVRPPGEHVLVDHTYPTKAQYTAWVPARPEDERWFPPNPFKPARDRHAIPNMVPLPVFKTPVDTPRQFHVQLAHPYFKDVGSMPLPKDPGDDVGRKKAVKGWLQQSPIFTAKHPLPAYIRAGYDTMDEFMGGWDWQFDYDRKTGTLKYNPIRDEYAIIEPVTTRPGGALITNYYSQGKPPKRLAKKVPIEMLLIGDPFFFTTY